MFHSGLVQFTTNNLLVFHILLLFNCVKSVQIQNFFWSVFSCACTRKNSVSGYFSRSTKVKKYEILVKYLSHCTQNRAITSTYFKKHQRKLTQKFFSQMCLINSLILIPKNAVTTQRSHSSLEFVDLSSGESYYTRTFVTAISYMAQRNRKTQ